MLTETHMIIHIPKFIQNTVPETIMSIQKTSKANK